MRDFDSIIGHLFVKNAATLRFKLIVWAHDHDLILDA